VARLEESLRLVEQGRLIPPPGCHLPTFLLSDGRIAEPPKAVEVLTLASLRDGYLDSRPKTSWEENTRLTLRIHFRHLSDT
jgi:hypothetical protein